MYYVINCTDWVSIFLGLSKWAKIISPCIGSISPSLYPVLKSSSVLLCFWMWTKGFLQYKLQAIKYPYETIITIFNFLSVSWLTSSGLTSHSAIFQLYSDRTVVQFPNFSPAAGHPMPRAARCRAYPDTGTGTSEDVFYLLAIRGPTRGVTFFQCINASWMRF